MSYIQVSSENHVAVLTIDRPKALNALNSEVLGELEAAIDALDLSDVRALIITGSGEKSFVAGADIGEMSTLTKAEGEAFGKKGNAVFGQPETGLGITPGFGGTQRLARLVSPGMAKQILYTAKNIKADEALRIGLVNAVYPQEELMAAAMKLAGQIAVNAPIAVRATKAAINTGLEQPMDEAIVTEEKLFGSCFETEDQKAGMANFLEKDKAKKLKVVPYQGK